MGGNEIKTLIRKQPFEPIEIGLYDGRSMLIRHPDQVVVSRRHVIFGLAHIRGSRVRNSTPPDGGALAKDWLLVDMIHVVSAEPANGPGNTTSGRRRGRTKKR